ncbi:hypothetical protein [Streptomyces purpurascens]
MAEGVLVEGADAAAAVQQCLVAAGGDGIGRLDPFPGEPGAGLDGEEFAGRVRHGLGDGLVDPLLSAEERQRRGAARGRVVPLGGNERPEGLGQPFLASPFARDAFPGEPQQTVEGDGRRHGLQPVEVVDGGVQQAEVRQAGRGAGRFGGDVPFAQGSFVQFLPCRAQFFRVVHGV